MILKPTFRLRLLLVLALLLGVGAAAYTHHVVCFDANTINYFREGQNDARLDLKNGIVRIKDAPTDTPTERIYKESLEKDHGIARDALIGDPSSQLADYIRGFNEVMEEEIERRLGASTISRIREQANEDLKRKRAEEAHTIYSPILGELGSNPKTVLVVGARTWDRLSNLEPEMRSTFSLEDMIQQYNMPPLTPLSPSLLEAIKDYKHENETPDEIRSVLATNRSYVLVDEAEFKGFFETPMKGWEDFYRKYAMSTGYVTFSKIGFNREMTEALVYVERRCGSLCADGRFEILTKEAGTWRIKQLIPFYAS